MNSFWRVGVNRASDASLGAEALRRGAQGQAITHNEDMGAYAQGPAQDLQPESNLAICHNVYSTMVAAGSGFTWGLIAFPSRLDYVKVCFEVLVLARSAQVAAKVILGLHFVCLWLLLSAQQIYLGRLRVEQK